MTFSIVVPTFNEERIIAKTLGAIRHHLSNIDYELIVTDDGSTDRTCDIAERYADRVVRFTGKKGTIGANRNRGARVAHGEYFVDIVNRCPWGKTMSCSCALRGLAELRSI